MMECAGSIKTSGLFFFYVVGVVTRRKRIKDGIKKIENEI